MVNDKNPQVRLSVAKRIDQKGLHLMVKDKNIMVKRVLARRIDQKGLYLMAKDTDPEIRSEVVKRIDPEGLRMLQKDKSKMVRKHVNERLKNIAMISEETINKFSKTLKLTPKDIPVPLQKIIKGINGVKKLSRDAWDPLDELYKSTKLWPLHDDSRDGWLDSSNSNYALFLKKVIVKLYGGSIYHHDAIDNTDEFYTKGLEKYGIVEKDLKTYIEAQKNLTSSLLDIKYPDKDEFMLYRGTTSEELETEKELKVGDTVTIAQNSLSSWTLNKSAAKKFGDVVIESTFSKDDIFSFFITHSYSGFEKEFMVIGRPGKTGTIIKIGA